jgi:8-amino-7-oxononanoate synthase
MPPRTTSSAASAQRIPNSGRDVFQKCSDYDLANSIRREGIYSYYRDISSPQDPVVIHKGDEVVMLGSNNYLGLANHPEVKDAAQAAIRDYGTGCAGSRLLNGTTTLHGELEDRLAKFMNREAVLTFATGFQVNLGVLSCLLSRHDIAYLDNLDHACIVDGARLGDGKIVKFRHNDMEDLAGRLELAPEGKGRFIVVDGVYSMEGDLCDLPGLVALKQQHGARLMVDDAHGIGVIGEHGRGTAEHFGLEADVDLVMGTFSKSLATAGGFIAGDRYVVDFIAHNARAQIFSAASPPPCAAAALAALEIVEREPERRAMLWENVSYMLRELRALGFDTGASDSPVIPLVVGDDWVAFRMVARLQEEGVFANPVITPAVPPGRAMVRTSYMATHTREHLDRSLEALAKVAREFGVI